MKEDVIDIIIDHAIMFFFDNFLTILAIFMIYNILHHNCLGLKLEKIFSTRLFPNSAHLGKYIICNQKMNGDGEAETKSCSSNRILAFGDSLTAGYSKSGTMFSPYSSPLSAMLENVEIEHIGLSGWTTQEMVENLNESECIDACLRVWKGLELTLRSAAEQNQQGFKVVLILAGTNDLSQVLGQRYSVETVVENLKKLHETAYSYNCRTAAITIPECFAEGRWTRARDIRRHINEELRTFSAQSNGKTVLVDLARQFPYFDLSPEDRSLYWDDGLHFTHDGYGRMASVLFSSLREWL